MSQGAVSNHASREQVGALALNPQQTRRSVPDAQSNQAHFGALATPKMEPLVNNFYSVINIHYCNYA